MMKIVSLGFLVAGVVASDVAQTKNRPVTKVVNLLKDMLKQLEKEQKEDEDIYQKMACWCETNDKEKTQSIKDAESRIAQLTTSIEEGSAASARLSTEIKNLAKEVAENQEALDQATAIRQKQLAEFNEEEKDMLLSIASLSDALLVLGKHNGGSMLQVAFALDAGIKKHANLLRGIFTPSEREAMAAFIEAPQDYFDAAPTFKQSYAPQSGAIFGILQQMKETFETNLASSQKEEMANQKAYEELKAAKEEEIAAGQAQLNQKQQELADTDEKLAEDKQDIEDTRASLSADEEFLLMLKEKCQMTDKEWEERQKTRALEMEACSKAVAVLSSDDAHDLFTRTFNFVQVESAAMSDRRSRAAQVLSAAAKQLHRPRLAALAAKVKLDAFTRVKKAIDDLVAELLKQKADEIKHKDFCVEEFNTNQLQTEKKDKEKVDLIAKITELELNLESLTKAIENLKSEIAEMQVELTRAGEDRQKQNKEFQQTVADQRETQKMLTAALDILSEFYGKAALLQGPPPPAGFETYKKSGASGGVMGMIKQIINDAKAMEEEAQRGEEEAQAAYEDFVKETNTSVEEKNKDIANKSDTKAKAEGDLVETKEAKEAALLELENLSNYKAELHQSCDFVVKNFDLRQSARDEEVDALRQAKSILDGAKFSEFLQEA
jgi:hypothetical protein